MSSADFGIVTGFARSGTLGALYRPRAGAPVVDRRAPAGSPGPVHSGSRWCTPPNSASRLGARTLGVLTMQFVPPFVVCCL